jgi:hypothetical protein
MAGCLINRRERLAPNNREQFMVGQHFDRDVAALDYLRALAVQPVPDLFDGLQIATLRHLGRRGRRCRACRIPSIVLVTDRRGLY